MFLYWYVGCKALRKDYPMITIRQQDNYSKFDFLVETELEQIRRYIMGLDIAIKEELVRTNELIDKEIWPDKSDPMPTMVIEMLVQLEHFTPSLFYKSSLTILYSFFESTFREIAKAEKEIRKIKLKPDDLKGNGIQLFRDYLVKVIGVDLSSLDSSWLEIDKAKKIRNYIVHTESDNADNKKNQQVKEICDKNVSLSFTEGTNEVNILSSKYLTEFADNIETFLIGLINILRQVKPSAQQNA